MKKLMMGFAVLSLLFGAASCTKETKETALDAEKKEVSFRAALGKQALSRAAEFTAWKENDELTVYAYKAGSADAAYTPFELTYDGSVWEYATPVTSTGANVWYYSWFPESTGISANNAGVNSYSFNYAVRSVDNQEDLVAVGVSTSDYMVTLGFEHILSQVNFALYETEHLKITVNSITLKGVKDTGTWTMGASRGWSNVDGAAQYSYELDGVSNITDGSTATGTLIPLKGADNALMLMPQTFADDAALEINFDLARVGTNGGDEVIVDDEVSTVLLNNFEILEWTRGKRYLYQLDFSSYIQTGLITFNVSVAGWDGEEEVIATLEVAAPTLASIEKAIANHSAANAANSDLAVFTISVPDAIEEMTLSAITGFNEADEIVIEFADATSAGNFTVAVDGWSSEVEGNAVILTCTTPTVA